MKDLKAALEILERNISAPRSGPLLFHEGHLDETTLAGTPDGLLRLAHDLIKLVDDFAREEPELDWSNERHPNVAGRHTTFPRDIFRELPNASVTVVGTSVFETHADLVNWVKSVGDATAKTQVQEDPDWADPHSEGLV